MNNSLDEYTHKKNILLATIIVKLSGNISVFIPFKLFSLEALDTILSWSKFDYLSD